LVTESYAGIPAVYWFLAQFHGHYKEQIPAWISSRWVQSVRDECLDHILIFNDPFRRVLKEYADYYNWNSTKLDTVSLDLIPANWTASVYYALLPPPKFLSLDSHALLTHSVSN